MGELSELSGQIYCCIEWNSFLYLLHVSSAVAVVFTWVIGSVLRLFLGAVSLSQCWILRVLVTQLALIFFTLKNILEVTLEGLL